MLILCYKNESQEIMHYYFSVFMEMPVSFALYACVSILCLGYHVSYIYQFSSLVS